MWFQAAHHDSEADKAAHHSWLIAGEEVINAATLVAQALVPDWGEGGGWQVVVVVSPAAIDKVCDMLAD